MAGRGFGVTAHVGGQAQVYIPGLEAAQMNPRDVRRRQDRGVGFPLHLACNGTAAFVFSACRLSPQKRVLGSISFSLCKCVL